MSRTSSLLALAAVLAACGGDSTGTPSKTVATVTVTPSTASITQAGTQTLTAVTRDADGNALTGRTVRWTSATPTIASVSASGVVTGVNPGGPVVITASSEGKSGSAAITVNATQVVVSRVDITPATNTLAVGGTVQLVATPRDAAGNALAVPVTVWATNNDQVATVALGGLVTAVGPGGPVTISAQAGAAIGQATVTVTAPVSVTVAALALGGYHDCALMSDGSAKC